MAVSQLAMRRLTLSLTTLTLLNSLFWIIGLHLLPEDPLRLRQSLTLYFLFVLLVSVFGLYGAIRRNATFINIFASHLLLDSLVCLIPRLVVINFSTSLPSLTCTSSRPLSHQNLREAVEYRISSTSLVERWWTPRKLREVEHCLAWTWSLDVVFIAVVVTLMVIQFWVAVKTRRYASWLERTDALGTETERREKDIC